MAMQRREFLALAGAAALAPLASPPEHVMNRIGETMYGLIGKMTAMSGKRDTLAAILLEGTEAMM